MKIKVLETKLQTILEDDLIKITNKNSLEEINEILGKLISKIARLNDAVNSAIYIKEEYISEFENTETTNLFCSAIDALTCLCDNESESYKNKFLEIINEIFINQDLYDLVNENIPSLNKLIDKLNSENCLFNLVDIINWIKDGLDCVETENIEELNVYDYLDLEFEDFNNLFVPREKEKIVVNKKYHKRINKN